MSFFNTLITSSALVTMLIASAPMAHAMEEKEDQAKTPKTLKITETYEQYWNTFLPQMAASFNEFNNTTFSDEKVLAKLFGASTIPDIETAQKVFSQGKRPYAAHFNPPSSLKNEQETKGPNKIENVLHEVTQNNTTTSIRSASLESTSPTIETELPKIISTLSITPEIQDQKDNTTASLQSVLMLEFSKDEKSNAEIFSLLNESSKNQTSRIISLASTVQEQLYNKIQEMQDDIEKKMRLNYTNIKNDMPNLTNKVNEHQTYLKTYISKYGETSVEDSQLYDLNNCKRLLDGAQKILAMNTLNLNTPYAKLWEQLNLLRTNVEDNFHD